MKKPLFTLKQTLAAETLNMLVF